MALFFLLIEQFFDFEFDHVKRRRLNSTFLDANPLNLVERDLVTRPIIELCCSR